MLLFVINFIVFFATCQKETSICLSACILELTRGIVGHWWAHSINSLQTSLSTSHTSLSLEDCISGIRSAKNFLFLFLFVFFNEALRDSYLFVVHDFLYQSMLGRLFGEKLQWVRQGRIRLRHLEMFLRLYLIRTKYVTTLLRKKICYDYNKKMETKKG